MPIYVCLTLSDSHPTPRDPYNTGFLINVRSKEERPQPATPTTPTTGTPATPHQGKANPTASSRNDCHRYYL